MMFWFLDNYLKIVALWFYGNKNICHTNQLSFDKSIIHGDKLYVYLKKRHYNSVILDTMLSPVLWLCIVRSMSHELLGCCLTASSPL